jgi:hypothetical protein
MAEKIVRIGGASGAWGDSPMAIPQLLGADVQYLMMDFLAEVTMSLLARARLKDPDAGFPPDFVAYLKRPLPEIARRGIKVVSNAGGVNPRACKRALEAVCAELAVPLRIAVVEGDDLMPRLDELRGDVRELVSGLPLPPRMLTANAYLGALPIAAALGAGADIVVTGRCADSALALGILMHEFGWTPHDYDRLAAGSLVGHLLECGPQSTGGTFTDWEQVPDWHNIGYPIAECAADGTFVLTKPDGTGGLVIPATAAEQVLYEVGGSGGVCPAGSGRRLLPRDRAPSRPTSRAYRRRQGAPADRPIQGVGDLSGWFSRRRIDFNRRPGCGAQGRTNRAGAARSRADAVPPAEPG